MFVSNKHSEITVAMTICVSIAIVILISAVHHTITRLRINPGGVPEGEERLSTCIPLLCRSKAGKLRHLCLDISRDLIQVTGD